MSRQGTAVVRLLFLIISATFLVAAGGVWAQDAGNADSAGESPAHLSPAVGGIQDQAALEDSKPPLIGGVPSEPPPFAVPGSPSTGQPGTLFQSSPDAPAIEVWHGSAQKAGLKGDPQKWVNIVGRVTPKPTLLTYSLNGSPAITLRTGSDTRRLQEPGDFNIELDYTELNPGSNQVIIIATDSEGDPSQAVVTVDYQGGGVTWATPFTYSYDWATASRIDDLAQVVDGKWLLQNNVVKPDSDYLGYDRLIGIGDLSWRDYTVTVPIKFTAIDADGYKYPSNGPGVGVILRWQGHYNDGKTEPVEGWRRLGAFALYHWGRSTNDEGQFVYSEAMQMYRYLGNPGHIITKDRKLNMNTTYYFKVDVQSTGVANPPANYRFKVWKVGDPEPVAWDIEGPGFVGEPANGGILLVAHHVDAQFGKVEVELRSTMPPPTLLVNTTGSGSGSVNVSPASPINTYRFGEDVQLTAIPDSGSSFTEWQGALSGDANPQWLEMFSSKTVTAEFSTVIGAPVSDDFSACVLNQRWMYINPLGDSAMTMTGSSLQISVPAGISHDMWPGNRNAPRVMQSITNENFELDVKFNSPMSNKYQLQGVLVEANSQNFLRYNFQHDGSTYRIAAYTVLNNVMTERINAPITIGTPMYLRTNRTGNTWTLSYSGDGQNWTQATQFTFNLQTTSAGVFVGNADQNPAMVSQIDYFFNTASPIVPQDNARKLNITTAGSGSGIVTKSPQKDNYDCNESVTLEAIPNLGSVFDGWGGDLAGAANQVTIQVTDDMDIVANFSKDVGYHSLEMLTEGEGTVQTTPTGPLFEFGTEVSLLASPAAGYQFVRWEGAITGNTNPYDLYIDGDKTVKAVFAPIVSPGDGFIFLPTILTPLN